MDGAVGLWHERSDGKVLLQVTELVLFKFMPLSSFVSDKREVDKGRHVEGLFDRVIR